MGEEGRTDYIDYFCNLVYSMLYTNNLTVPIHMTVNNQSGQVHSLHLSGRKPCTALDGQSSGPQILQLLHYLDGRGPGTPRRVRLQFYRPLILPVTQQMKCGAAAIYYSTRTKKENNNNIDFSLISSVWSPQCLCPHLTAIPPNHRIFQYNFRKSSLRVHLSVPTKFPSVSFLIQNVFL